ncbi:MAG: hypothetical protein [Olavius algarvensis Delta 4 endosymbiont]|nr:MAG: hypothetical protein [Olavius algarvensis Delta 4 endosymbiont]
MTIHVDPDWWKSLFDEVYLLTDARSINDEAVTREEIRIFASLIPLEPGDRILDLCGGHGRHSLELSRRGLCECTVLDYSQPLLDIGARDAAETGCAVRFVQGDARRTRLPPATFDHVLILGNSLGYLPEPDADLSILKEGKRLLKPGGWLLLDVSDGEAMRTKITPLAWHEIGDDIVVCRLREVNAGRIHAREMVLSKQNGLIRDKTYGIQLYGQQTLATLVIKAGFEKVTVYNDASALPPDVDMGCMNHRLVAVARKP